MDSSRDGAAFQTTHWTVVLAAGGVGTPQSRAALEQLCAAYWKPLYAYLRREGHDMETAADLIQSLFADLLEKGDFARADRERGRFRSYLLGCLKHRVSHHREHERALKRGGGTRGISIDQVDGERYYGMEPIDDKTPDRVFDRRCALTTLDRALERLGQEYERNGQTMVFDVLKDYLSGDSGVVPYEEAAARLGKNANAVKTAVSRLRQRYGAVLREVVGESVASPEDVDDEIRHLFEALAP